MTTAHTPPRGYAIGVDYGTNSVRAVIVDISNGEELATSIWTYRHGTDGVILDDRDPNVARQHPRDYLDGFDASVAAAVAMARKHTHFDPALVVGLGVDTTGSTPIPVDRRGTALAMLDEFNNTPGERDGVALEGSHIPRRSR